ncbi:MAG: MauE/DoxX family redox-associated membrane protein [Mycobacteriales bacterium]
MPLGKGGDDLVVAGVAARFFLAVVFLAAGVSKLGSRYAVVSAVRGYDVLPVRLARALGGSLAWVELTFGVCLAFGVAVDVISIAGACLLISFALGIAVNLARGREIDCGCGSPVLPSRITWAHVGRNVVLSGICVVSAGAAANVIAITPTLVLRAGEPTTTFRALPGVAIELVVG